MIRLKNIVSENTDDWVQGNTNEYMAKEYKYSEGIKEDHFYFTRLSWKFETTDEVPTHASIFLNGDLAWMNEINESQGFEAGKEYIIYGIRRAEASIAGGMTGKIFTRPYNGVTNYVRRVMTIDITDLVYGFPYFGSLYGCRHAVPINPIMREIMNACPYISSGETFEFDGRLHNIMTNPNEHLSTTIEKKVYSRDWSQCLYRDLKPGEPDKIKKQGLYKKVYTRAWVKVNYNDSEKYEVTIFERPFEALATEDVTAYMEKDGQVVSFLGTTQGTDENENNWGINFATTLYGFKTPPWEVTEDITVESRDVMYLHLYKDGALLYFYLLGLNDNQIKTYLDSLPFFANSYDIRSPFLSYDGLSYYHDKIKERLDSMQASIDSLTQQLSTLS